LTPKHEDFEHDVKLDVEARVRQGVKAVLEEVLQDEMTQHLEAGYRELTPTRRGERNGYYQRNLVTPAGKIERLEVPRDREGEFVTEVFERYKRMTGDVEEAVLEMYLLRDLGQEDSRGYGGAQSREGRQGCCEPHRPSTRGGAEGLAGAPFGGEGISLPLPRRHLPEGALGSCCDEHGAFGVCRGGRGGLSGGLGGGGCRLRERRGLRLLATGAHRPGSRGGAPGALRRPRRHKERGGGRAARRRVAAVHRSHHPNAMSSRTCRAPRWRR
jgi:hypothetical protein